jgi:hypothetical protein
LFINNNDLSYEEFKSYFNSRDIESPDVSYYSRVKDKFLEINKKTANVDDIIEKEEYVSIDKNIVKKQKKSISKSKKALKNKVKKNENN